MSTPLKEDPIFLVIHNAALEETIIRKFEKGGVGLLEQSPFTLLPEENEFLDLRWVNPFSKNINLSPNGEDLNGVAKVSTEAEKKMRLFLERYRRFSEKLIEKLLPSYPANLGMGGTSLRLHQVEKRNISWRKDDSRLHVDAFPSNPMEGKSILRVFTNINPFGEPRVWRIGEPFEDFAKKFMPHTHALPAFKSFLLWRLKITKRRRTEYDERMLQLHDLAKRDITYQKFSPQKLVKFPANSSWMVFSDRVLHAAMSGQFMLEQTFYLPSSDLYFPDIAPFAILKNLI